LDYEVSHILVDEAQDLSSKQWDLVKVLSDEFYAGKSAQNDNRTVFAVGDFKQSIFGFQGAAPKQMQEAQTFFNERCTAVAKNFQYLNMDLSYRSKSNVIEFVNKLFVQITPESFVCHDAFAKEDGHVELWPLIDADVAEEDDGWDLPKLDFDTSNQTYKLARTIVGNIKEWLEKGRLICGTHKKVEPQDIMILVKTRSELIRFLSAELKKIGVDCTTPALKDNAKNLLFKDCLSLLYFAFDPYDELNLAGLLKTPFFNIYDKQIYDLKKERGSNLLECLKLHKQDIYELLNTYRELLINMGYHAGLYHIIFHLNYIESFIARFGKDCLHTLYSFLNALKDFENEAELSTFQHLEQYISEYNVAHSNKKDSVRIMTVHASKGLQAPIVILADANSVKSSSDSLFYSGELLVIKHRKSSELLDKLVANQKSEDESEDLRLLYVAITRAESELYFIGTNTKSSRKSWYDWASSIYNDSLKSDYAYCNNADKKQSAIEDIKVFTKFPMVSRFSNVSVKTNSTIRGEIIHFILENHINLDRVEMLDILISRFSAHFSEDKLNEFLDEAYANIKAFPEIFEAPDYRNELSIKCDAGVGIKRIDKLLFKGDEVHIIDYKTDMSSNDIRGDYMAHINAYSALIS